MGELCQLCHLPSVFLNTDRSLLPPLLKIYHTLPSASSVPLDGPLTNVIHTLITIPISSSLRSIWFEEQNGDHHDVLMRTFHLLDSSFSLFFPSNTSPDHEKIRESFKQTLLSTSISPDTSPDDLLTPLVVLCTRLCLAEEECKKRIRDWIIPENLDRTDPLDERKDFLGRCLRLLGSVYHTGLKNAVGEMLFAVADQDGECPFYLNSWSFFHVFHISNNYVDSFWIRPCRRIPVRKRFQVTTAFQHCLISASSVFG